MIIRRLKTSIPLLHTNCIKSYSSRHFDVFTAASKGCSPPQALINNARRAQIPLTINNSQLTINNSLPPGPPCHGAVTIVVPGLNMKPAAFLDIIDFLTQKGADVILVHLTGHENDLSDTTRHTWLAHLLEAYRHAETLVKDNPRPIYFLGFSVGALVNLDALSHHPGRVHCDKMVLLAPANALRWSSYLIKFFFPLGNKFGIPSLQPKEYRLSHKTPVQAYKNLFKMKKSIESNNYLNLNIPTLAAIDAKDELVSLKKLGKIINRYRLTRWQMFKLDSSYVGKDTRYHHLIINENTMGTENWLRFKSKIKDFFNL